MTDIRVGLCSWTDKTLIESGFYPREAATPAARLVYYASRFATVEIDSTYYALPSPGYAIRWLASTPDTFRFGVKSFSIFTFHRTKASSLPAWLRGELAVGDFGALVERDSLTHEQRVRLFDEFIEPVRMLYKAGRLSYLLFQFPPGFGFARKWLSYFKRLREMSGPLPLALEVRNRSWLERPNRDFLIKTLENENIALVMTDSPVFPNPPRSSWPLTAEWGTVVRYHGRNYKSWNTPGAGVHQKFRYDYSKEELNDWVCAVKESAERAKCVNLMFNNCFRDQAVRSAQKMRELLGIGDPSGQSSLGLSEE